MFAMVEIGDGVSRLLLTEMDLLTTNEIKTAAAVRTDKRGKRGRDEGLVFFDRIVALALFRLTAFCLAAPMTAGIPLFLS